VSVAVVDAATVTNAVDWQAEVQSVLGDSEFDYQSSSQYCHYLRYRCSCHLQSRDVHEQFVG
jgi:hypothetical protein